MKPELESRPWMTALRRLNCRRLQVRFPQLRTAEEQEQRLNWIAAELPDDPWADSRDEDQDGDAELGGRQ